MKIKILCGLWLAVVSLMLAIPAYAYSGSGNGGNGGLGNGMGTVGTHDGISAKSNGTQMYGQSNVTRNYDVSVYGTETGSQFWNVNANAPDTANRSQAYRTQSYSNSGYRATATTTTRNIGWGWLGLFGLLGLFGIRNRNPQPGD